MRRLSLCAMAALRKINFNAVATRTGIRGDARRPGRRDGTLRRNDGVAVSALLAVVHLAVRRGAWLFACPYLSLSCRYSQMAANQPMGGSTSSQRKSECSAKFTTLISPSVSAPVSARATAVPRGRSGITIQPK